MSNSSFPRPIAPDGQRKIAPTDISQFIRLEQCERYLRLRLHERAFGQRFMRDYDVTPQSIPVLLTRSGSDFEEKTEAVVAERFPTENFAERDRESGSRQADNERLALVARDLAPRSVQIIFQPRLEVELDGWMIRGDVDIVRLERDDAGRLSVTIADMKSSRSAKVEHRVQVAFYYAMLAKLLDESGVACDIIRMAILYRGPSEADDERLDDKQRESRDLQRVAAREQFGVADALLEVVADPEHYLRAVEDLVTGADSKALRVAEVPFDQVPYHLGYKCDGCIYSEFCMKWSANRDDLSLIPHLSVQEKSSLRRAGVTTTRELAAIKQPLPGEPASLQPAPGQDARARSLAATWPVGPRLDELIHRARRYRTYLHDPIEAISYIPSKGYGSLPYSDANQNPNLIRVYIDAQHDYLHGRVYLLGALIVGSEDGVESSERRRSVVAMAGGPPATSADEKRLLVEWIRGVLTGLAGVAAPDEDGLPKAPIHLIFYDKLQQKMLLDALSRHFASIVEATPLFDFITQIAAFDSPVATFLEDEIRELRNYPMVCQSLQAVSAYLRFDWNQPEEYRRLFRVRMFDFWGKLEREDGDAWYTNRSRFNSFIPLEYAYAAWGELGEPEDADPDDYRRFRGVDAGLIQGFQRRRLEALEHVAKDFRGNRQTVKSAFDIPSLAEFEDRSRELANALQEFLTIERHTTLAAWKTARLAPPERRVLSGEALVVRYVEPDQEPGVAELNRQNRKRQELRETFRAEYKAARPDATRVTLPKEQRQASDWSQEGMQFWLRIETDGVDCDLEEILSLSSIRERDTLVLFPRWAVDSRLPEEERLQFTPTPKQLLYGIRVMLKQIVIDRPAGGRATAARVLVEMQNGQGRGENGFVFGTTMFNNQPLEHDQVYTLDSNPTDWYGSFLVEVVKGLIGGGENTLFDWLSDTSALAGMRVAWPDAAAVGQSRFLAGLDALGAADVLHDFEPGKRDYIGGHGDTPILLVQGPPGTGKSYSTAFALLARIQGAMTAGIPFRAFLSCKTHAATDVLLDNVRVVQGKLAAWFVEQPEIAERYFDRRLTRVPLFRVRPRGEVALPIIPLPADRDKEKGQPTAIDQIMAHEWAVVAAAPAGTRGAIKDKWGKEIFGHEIADCLILDEASQMNLAEAILAALPLKHDGRLIVVGDHRQMPPIVKHSWSSEPRRTFQEYRSYESLFEMLLPLGLPIIRFEESFRLHAEMAEFLRREIYQQDDIPFHSKQTQTLGLIPHDDPFVAAVLDPGYPLVVIIHDEGGSQLQNTFERELISPVLEALASIPAVKGHDGLPRIGLDPWEGLGVVVPHRAQRAAFIEHVPCLTERDPVTGAIVVSAVDTVERFQGDERHVIVYTATESDSQYLVAASKFLMDPRRLTVALSRAKSKMIVVASRSVFGIFSADEETFVNAQLWKNLLRETCVVPLWRGTSDTDGQPIGVEVWGNRPGASDEFRALADNAQKTIRQP